MTSPIPDQITINLVTLKKKLLNILVKTTAFYAKINRELVFFWRIILPTNSTGLLGGIFRFLRTLLDNPATALVLNTILLAAISYFGGVILSASIIYFINLFTALNIVVFCIQILMKKD